MTYKAKITSNATCMMWIPESNDYPLDVQPEIDVTPSGTIPPPVIRINDYYYLPQPLKRVIHTIVATLNDGVCNYNNLDVPPTGYWNRTWYNKTPQEKYEIVSKVKYIENLVSEAKLLRQQYENFPNLKNERIGDII